MELNYFFSWELIEAGIIRITGAGNELMYLIVGSKMAALIDTGSGVGNIKEYVEELTKLPIIVILTHAHIDHSAGAFYFNEVYLNEQDAKLLNLEFSEEECRLMYQGIKDFVAGTNKELAIHLQEKDMVKPFHKNFLPLSDGDKFELGGLTLEIIECPGHTKGSVVVLIKEQRAIIFGDSCNPFVWLFLPESTGVAEYKNSLLRVKTREEEYDKVYLSHAPKDSAKEILDEVIHICDLILDGKSDDIPYSVPGMKDGYIAKKVKSENNNLREDGKIGNIVYKK
ncbi:MBL fold metallo-hydrolase [Anaerocolumna sp. AGMB13025]|uniref:MBL fold metallo-hydrolase n=1 Tax=Anaerocolumna sp. AGMB13025 TaxID=3039116 RepID=UPI00242015E8|nr:MBL fold metallo-hydrolase [Anaerocolumna sp. AGMB13025]WFR56349.1 MBL fold metallo-hydrolase [Anaerocolumna sp. AGMB13025]